MMLQGHGSLALSRAAAVALVVAWSSFASAEDPQRARAEAAPPGAPPHGLSASDWSSIRAAYEARRHAIQAVEAGHRARNPGQRWTTHFDGRAFLTVPDDGEWTWGLELARYGWGELECSVDAPQCVTVEGGRVAYEWDDRLTEWYVNDARGLEHGYTVCSRPAKAEAGSALTLELAVRGDLSPVISSNARDISFADVGGDTLLTYSGLAAFDADGRPLEASFEYREARLLLRVDDVSARYPLTIDPLAQQAYLKASNPGIFDWFGRSIAISGDTVVVGAFREDSGATGVNGNEGNDSAPTAGAAYVFVRTGTTWSQQAYLKAMNTEANDWFGYSVAISRDTIVVGAPFEDSNASGVNGDGSNNIFEDSGAAYVFVRSGTTWTRQAYLKASNPGPALYGFWDGDQFGTSVAISGDTIVVGSPFEDSNATGVNGDQNNNDARDSGAAYVFVRSGASWSQQAYVKASNTGSFDGLGVSAAIDGDTVVVGASGEDCNSTGVNGDQSNNDASRSGAAYVFVRSGSNWSQDAYLKASNTGTDDLFGTSVAISGDTVVIGAPEEDSNATGVSGDESNEDAPTSGAAYVFSRSGTSWSQEAYLKASNTGTNDRFGWSIAVSDDRAVAGAFGEDGESTGVNGDQDNDLASDSGAAYVFVRNGSRWSHHAYVKASNSQADDLFGTSVAISGDTLVAGALKEDSNATGSNGNQDNNSTYDSGAAYVFHLEPEPFPLCFGDGSGASCPCGNTGGLGRGCASSAGPGGLLEASGSAYIHSMDLVLLGSDLVPGEAGLYFQGDQPLAGGAGIPFGDGLRCAGGEVIRLETRVADASGSSSTTLDIASAGGVLPGDTLLYQLLYRDPAPGPCNGGFNLTNALQVLWVQ